MVAEHGDQRRRGLYASWPQVGVPAGNLLAAGVLALLAAVLSDDGVPALGLAGPVPAQRALLVLVGLWIRLRDRGVAAVPGGRGDRRRKAAGAAGRGPHAATRASSRSPSGARIGTDVAFYIFTLFILTYVTDAARAVARARR